MILLMPFSLFLFHSAEEHLKVDDGLWIPTPGINKTTKFTIDAEHIRPLINKLNGYICEFVVRCISDDDLIGMPHGQRKHIISQGCNLRKIRVNRLLIFVRCLRRVDIEITRWAE